MGRLERIATLSLLFLTACTVFPPVHAPLRAESRRVAIPGEEADTLAETLGPAEEGLVPVRAHDGRELWVREGALGGPALVPGTWVLVRSSEQLVMASVVRSLDDYVELQFPAATAIVPVADVVARLHHGPAPVVATTDPPPPPPEVTPPAPPTPLERMVVLEAAPLARAGRLVDCAGDVAHVVLADETEVHVPRTDLRPLRVRAGDRVSALWSGSPYPAIILATRDSLVRVRWEDESEQWIELTEIVAVEGETSGTVAGCSERPVLVDEGTRARIGRLLACDGDHATVLSAEGTPRTVELASLSRVPLRVGDTIEARWNGSPYEAVVLALGERLHVRWYDGTEGDVDPADLVTYRAHTARPAEAPAC